MERTFHKTFIDAELSKYFSSNKWSNNKITITFITKSRTSCITVNVFYLSLVKNDNIIGAILKIPFDVEDLVSIVNLFPNVLAAYYNDNCIILSNW